MFLVDQILELLHETNDWCTLEAIAHKTQLSLTDTLMLLNFLAKYNFATIDPAHRRARITPHVHRFLHELSQAEQEEATTAYQNAETSPANSRTPPETLALSP